MIDRKTALGKPGIARNYKSTLRRLERFCRCSDISFTMLTPAFIEEYETWLSQSGIRSNSVSFYLRNLRALYNVAVSRRLTRDRRPFKNRYTKFEKTAKRAISIADIRRIMLLDLSQDSNLDFARDLFMFSFYCRGMSFIDAAFLTTDNIKCSQIVYTRHKTGQELRIGLNRHIEGIIRKWSENTASLPCPSAGQQFLLPILSYVNGRGKGNLRARYEAALRRTNKALKIIARKAGLNVNLTTYVSRHSWATIAKHQGIPTSVISDALGHDSELTTRIYLDSMTTDAIDHANATILRSLH